MQVSIGRFESSPTTTELLVLKDPCYVAWVFDQTKVDGKLSEIKEALARHIAVFDSKTFRTRCSRCSAAATRGCVYAGAVTLTWWCDECRPPHWTIPGHPPVIVRTYQDVLEHVRYNCESNRQQFKSVVKAFARSKGAPFRISESAAQEFLD